MFRRPEARPLNAWLGGILGLALVLRLAVVVWLRDTVPYSDAAYYHLAAEKMAADWTFPFDASQVEYYGKLGWWPPLYPAFLSGIYRMAGVDHRAAVFVQALVGTLVVALVYRLGLRIGGARLARTGALLVAVDPTYVFLTNILASENLYVLWLVLGWLLAGGIWRGAPGGFSRRRAVASGIAFALGALTRAVGLGVPIVVALAARRWAADSRTWRRGVAWMLAAAALTIAPWTLRNALVAGSPALVCFGGGLNFYFGHNPVAVGYRDLAQTPMAGLGTQAAIDHEGWRLGWVHLGSAPLGFFTRAAGKVAALFGSPSYAPHANSAILLPDGWQRDPEKGRQAALLRERQREKNRWLDGLFSHLAYAHSLLLAAGALVACCRWGSLPLELRLAVWLAALWISAHVVFWAQPRFRYPMEIPMALLAAHALGFLRPRRGVAIGLLAALVGFSGCTGPPPLPPPGVETWGDPDHPWDDPIEVAARNALGPRPPEYESKLEPVSLGEFVQLSEAERNRRRLAARQLVTDAEDHWRRTGADSLPPFLEAVRIDPSFAHAYFEAARIVLSRGATARAHALTAQGLRLAWDDAKRWAMMGEIYRREGDDRRARAALEHALALDAQAVPDAHQSLALLYLRAGESTRADSLAEHAPDVVRAWLAPYVDGVRARDQGDAAAATVAFRQAASVPGAPPLILVDWGNAAFSSGHLDEASGAFERALESDPELAGALLGLAIVERARGDVDAAIRSLEKLVAGHPQDATAHFNLGAACLEAGQRAGHGARADSLHARADVAFAASAALGFRVEESRLRHAEARLLLGDPAAAATEARALLDDPRHAAAARLLVARAAQAQKRPREIVVVLAPAFQQDSLSVDELDLLGNAYLDLELPGYALPVLERAHSRRPQDWKTAVNLGIARAQSGDLPGAEALLREVAAAHPDEPAVLQNLVAVLQRRGKRDEATEILFRLQDLRRK